MKLRSVLMMLLCVCLAGSGLAANKKKKKKAKKAKKPPVVLIDEVTKVTTRTWEQELEVARKTLDYVQQSVKLPKAVAALDRLEKSGESAANLDKLKKLRRQIVFAHPACGFDRLLINQNAPTLYSHNCDQYLGRHSRVGRGPGILTNWKSDNPKAVYPLEGKLPKGAYNKPKLHWDGKTMVFAFADHSVAEKNHRRYLVYEATLDGKKVRQLTGTKADSMERWGDRWTVLIEDNDPCYLPDGGVAFVSSRCQGFGRCHNGRYTPSLLMYRCDAGGQNIRMLSWGEANETDPVVLPDGRMAYTRWEYINRNQIHYHMLWWMKPDGTQPSNFYGNDTRDPCMVSETAPIPGTKKVVALATGHHSFSTGTVITIDPAKGENGPEPVRRITPDIGYFESEKIEAAGCYSTPWPLTEDLFLVAYSPAAIPKQGRKPADSYAIYLIDTFGGRELIYRAPEGSCFSPTPIVPRKAPPAVPSNLSPKPTGHGILSLQDVYMSRNDPDGEMKNSKITHLRISEIVNQFACFKNDSQPSLVRHESVKKILGTVPVEEDGSAMFKVPANTPIRLQALDGNGMAIMSERTFISLQDGERRSCVGCHEPTGTPPSPVRKMAMKKPPSEITPTTVSDYEGGFSYLRTVQPVFDRHCIGCHGLDKQKADLDLTATPAKTKQLEKRSSIPGKAVPNSYMNLAQRAEYGNKNNGKGILRFAPYSTEADHSSPRDYHSGGSRLVPMLIEGHGKVKLSREELQRIIEWLDTNGQLYGNYSYNRIEQREPDPAGEQELRKYIRECFGAELAAQPYHTLVNVGQPDQSRILRAPLAESSNGWNQISKGWKTTDDTGYQKMAALVEASIAPLPFTDLGGTCGRAAHGEKCLCRSCWVKAAEEQYQKDLAKR